MGGFCVTRRSLASVLMTVLLVSKAVTQPVTTTTLVESAFGTSSLLSATTVSSKSDNNSSPSNVAPTTVSAASVAVSTQPKPSIISTKTLGFVDSTNAPDTVRDLGFAGHIGSTYLLSFGDNVVCKSNHPQSGCEQGVIAANSVGIDRAPLSYADFDLQDGHPQQFCRYLKSLNEYPTGSGLELSAIQEDETGKAGFVYWQGINRGNRTTQLTGAGFATVDISGAYPVCKRVPHYWWNTTVEPNWSDHGIVTHDGYVYIFGGGPSDDSTIFLMRVALGQQATLSAYEYWHGHQWRKQKLINPPTSAAIFGGQPQNQGTIFWSEFYGQFMWVTVDQFASSIIASLAPHPHGPWSAFNTVYDKPADYNIIYAPSVRLQYSTAPNNLLIHFTEAGNNLHAIEVTLGK